MFRRALVAAPAQVSRAVRASATANTVSPLSARVAPLALSASHAPVSGRRSYHEKVLDHYNNPRNVGSLSKNDQDVGTGLVGAPACGDVMKIQIKVNPKDDTITDVRFKTFGCGSAIASSSYLTELVKGMTLEQASRIQNTEIAKELSLPPVKLHCSMLAEDGIKSAISNYYKKNPKAKATDLGSASASMPKVEVEKVAADSETTEGKSNWIMSTPPPPPGDNMTAIKAEGGMPQLVPFYFVNEVVAAFIIIPALIYFTSKYTLPQTVRRQVARMAIVNMGKTSEKKSTSPQK